MCCYRGTKASKWIIRAFADALGKHIGVLMGTLGTFLAGGTVAGQRP